MSHAPLRQALEAEGLWARKSLGQHFLLDLNVTRKIVRLAGPIEGRTVLEIGPGPGGLTAALLEAGAIRVVAVEKDARFAEFLRRRHDPARLTVLEADALDVDEGAVLHALGFTGPAPIIANLPYNVGTPLLVKWLGAGAWRGDMTLMFQKEVAQRIVARAGDPAYGRLTVLTAAVCRATLVMSLPPRAFQPPPKVESAVVRFEAALDPFDDLAALETVTAAAFGQRRKMLRSALAGLGGEALLQAAGIAPTLRAETLDQDQFRALARAYRIARSHHEP